MDLRLVTTENERTTIIEEFLAQAGWAQATRAAISGDASTRSYTRLTLNNKNTVLMNAPPSAETSYCPPNADNNERHRLGYNAIARLAGPNLNAFVGVDYCLREAGLSAPEIFNFDACKGLALIEDLGDTLFTNAVTNGIDEKTLYTNATDVLLKLRDVAPKPPKTPDYEMLTYDTIAMLAEVCLITDWYWPHVKKDIPSGDIINEYTSIWQEILADLSIPKAIVLRDYHAENLLWMPERDGIKRVGLIDFQDGLIGHYAYDLVSALEDARRDVAPELAAAILNDYCNKAKRFDDFNETEFRSEYAILGAQRNAKILGIFARLINRDNKPQYQNLIPRVEAHMRNNLNHPNLTVLKTFFAKHFPALTQ